LRLLCRPIECRMAVCRAAILVGPKANVHSIKSRHPRLTSGSALVLPTGVRTWAACYRCATAADKNTVEADLVHARRMTWRRNPGIFAVGAWVGEFLDEAAFAPRQRLRSRARKDCARSVDRAPATRSCPARRSSAPPFACRWPSCRPLPLMSARKPNSIRQLRMVPRQSMS